MALSAHQIKERDFFFGRGNYINKSNNCLCYEPILSDNEIIIQTDDVVSIVNKNNEVQYLLLIANNKAIYLNHFRQVKRVTQFIEGKGRKTYLVKLFKNSFKPYYCKKFEGYDFDSEVSFDGFYEQARLQGINKQKVRLN